MSTDDPPSKKKAPPLRVPAGIQFTPESSPPAARRSAARASTVPPGAAKAQARAVAAVSVRSGKPVIQRPPVNDPPKTVDRKPPPMFVPNQPRTWDDLGLDAYGIMNLVLRSMLGTAGVSGKEVSQQTGLAWPLIRDVMEHLKTEKLVSHSSTTTLGDFVSKLTEAGRKKAVESRSVTQHVGKAPVLWEHYLEAVRAQALSLWTPRHDDLVHAFRDIYVSEDMLDRLGPAVTSCKPMFLFGEPGNGKTSLAERMTRCFGKTIWIPYALDIDGHIVKLFDPAIHEPVDNDPTVMNQSRIDPRWVQIRRPTVVAGGELTIEQLDLQYDYETHVHEAPLQLKANCGTLLIDDFGRGKTHPKELLNRWIFPLEKQIDFLRLPDGRKFACPFECMLVFSTNLEPADLADEAFLRRIPYKIHVGDPDEEEFKNLVVLMAKKMKVELSDRSVKYLIERHYKMKKRPMRFCHPRDLLLQVVHLCDYNGTPKRAGPPEWDRVVSNYFVVA